MQIIIALVALYKFGLNKNRILLEKEFEEQKNYKDMWYYKNMETSLSKVWENDETNYSLNDLQNV